MDVLEHAGMPVFVAEYHDSNVVPIRPGSVDRRRLG